MSIEPIKLTTLTSVMSKIEEGNKSPVYKVTVIDQNRKTSIAFIKYIPPRAIFIECIAAQIARSLGLSCPRPMLVNVFPVKLPELNLDKNTIFYGSEDVGFPSLAQLVKFKHAEEKLRLWPDLFNAGCFDEWIANPDRHSGNIIYSGGKHFTLIDHSHAIPKGFHSISSTEKNSFLTLCAPTNRNDLATYKLMKTAENYVAKFKLLTSEDWKTLTLNNLYCTNEQATEVLSFLHDRLNVIIQLIGQKIGEPQADLYANP